MNLTVVVPPTVEALTVADARAHARIDHREDDALLFAYIVAAREMCEHELQRSIIQKTYELTLPALAATVELPMGGINGNLSVTSVTVAGVALNPATYTLVDGNVPTLTFSSVPTGQAVIRYVSGQPDPAAVPQALRQWMLLHVTHLYEQREPVVTGTIVAPLSFVSRLLDPYRTFR